MALSAVIRKDGNVYVAWCPELDVASQGPTVESAVRNLKEAVELLLEDEDVQVPDGPALITSFEVRHDKFPGAVGA